MCLAALAMNRVGLEIYLAVSYFHDFTVEDCTGFGLDPNLLPQILPGQIPPCFHRQNPPPPLGHDTVYVSNPEKDWADASTHRDVTLFFCWRMT